MTLPLQVVQDFQLPIDGSEVWQQLQNISGFVDDYPGATSFGGVGQISLVARLGHAKRGCDGPAGVEED